MRHDLVRHYPADHLGYGFTIRVQITHLSNAPYSIDFECYLIVQGYLIDGRVEPSYIRREWRHELEQYFDPGEDADTHDPDTESHPWETVNIDAADPLLTGRIGFPGSMTIDLDSKHLYFRDKRQGLIFANLIGHLYDLAAELIPDFPDERD